jgi:hypothetical protein
METATQQINNSRNSNGVFTAGNDAAGWYAISRNGIHAITFYEGKFSFTLKSDVTKFYTEKGFAKKISQLSNRGF